MSSKGFEHISCSSVGRRGSCVIGDAPTVASMNGDTVAREGEPVAAGTEIERNGLRGVEVGLKCVDRGFDFLDFGRGKGFGIVAPLSRLRIVHKRGGVRRGLSIKRGR